jgi:uncharacterized protein YlxW (UPF0749 family)
MTPPADAERPADTEPPSDPAPAGIGWPRRVVRTVLRPRLRRVDVAVAALLALLGFAAAVQVHSARGDGVLASARQEDLVRILDDLTSRSARLRQEVTTLTATQERLTTGSGREQAAVAEARRRAQVLGVLAGTIAARGPGLLVTIGDPEHKVTADVLLDALEELRDAGAEAVQLDGSVDPASNTPGAGQSVRVVAGTAFVDAGDEGGIRVDGVLLLPPYRFVVIGDPATMSAALAIPGGVSDNVGQRGGTTVVTRRESVLVGALRALARPRYARPADQPTG